MAPTKLPELASVKECLDTMLGVELKIEEVEVAKAAVTFRKEGREGIVMTELIADRQAALDGYLACDLASAKALGATILMAPPPDQSEPLSESAVEAVQELFNVLSGTMNSAAPDEHWVTGRLTEEKGAQALDPQLAVCRAVRCVEFSYDTHPAGILMLVLGAPRE